MCFLLKHQAPLYRILKTQKQYKIIFDAIPQILKNGLFQENVRQSSEMCSIIVRELYTTIYLYLNFTYTFVIISNLNFYWFQTADVAEKFL